MHDQIGWSINLGKWCGVQVRLHALFVFFALGVIYLSYLAGGPDPAHAWSLTPLAIAGLAVLFSAVVMHETAHSAAVLRVGGYVEEVVLTPFGGLGTYQSPNLPLAELAVHLAGPMANLMTTILCGIVLRVSGERDLLGLLNPLFPEGLGADAQNWVVWLKLTLWINWLLVVLNLTPAFPLDGGRLLQALLQIRFSRLTREQAGMIVVWLAKAVAAVLLLSAVLCRDASWSNPVWPAWFALGFLAAFFFFGARQEERRLIQAVQFAGQGELGDEGFSAMAPSLHTGGDGHGPLASWLARRREQQRRRQQQQEQEDEQNMDAVLAKLHQGGMTSLSPDERALLQRVSARYRNREQS